MPLRIVARASDPEQGLIRAVGAHRLAEAQAGERILLLDGLDEIPPTQVDSYQAFFDTVTELAGPTWILTSRPGYFRTEIPTGPDQIDTLESSNIDTLVIDPLPSALVRDLISRLPGGQHIIQSVAGLEQLATSPILLQAVHAALPFIEPGRPIQPWGVFDAWVRNELNNTPEPDLVMSRLTELAWSNFISTDYCIEETGISPQRIRDAGISGPSSSIAVCDRSRRAVPLWASKCLRVFYRQRNRPAALGESGSWPRHPVWEADYRSDASLHCRAHSISSKICDVGRTYVPTGNFIAGGDKALDERPLRIQHLENPAWIARSPVTHESWRAYLEANNARRVDANYLSHWGPNYQMPRDFEQVPIYGIWPEDAERFAHWRGARLPTANEWEKAVRGIDGRYWPWGDYWRPGAAITGEFGVPNPYPLAHSAYKEIPLCSPPSEMCSSIPIPLGRTVKIVEELSWVGPTTTPIKRREPAFVYRTRCPET